MGKVELKIQLDSTLVDEARQAGVAIDIAAQDGLQRAIAQTRATGMEERARQWADDNADALKDHEQRISEGGIFGEDLRTW